jgi:HPr kinase/phosphorylase
VSPSDFIHGVFVNVSGVGVLIIGDAGMGKSECALELVSGGHRLIADDVVEVKLVGTEVVGRAPDRFARLLEIRGLGFIDVTELFGALAFEPEHRIDLCLEFQDRDSSGDPDRLGGAPLEIEILGQAIRKALMSVGARSNLRLLVETAVKVFTGALTDTNKRLIAEHDALVSINAKKAGLSGNC